ncbi:MAG: hypothetical protein EBS70_04190, partial [Actinobacteria bacterium]|nr:hypothetical protein [Actinomycetota bacterium]
MKGLMQDTPMTLVHMFERAELYHRDKTIVTATATGRERTTYGAWAERTRRLGGVLNDLGISKDGRVATFAWNTARHLELYFAPPCTGRVAHTLNIRLFPEQLTYIVNHAEDEVIFIDRSLFALIAPLLPTFKTVRHLVIMDDGKGEAPTSVPGFEVHDYEKLLASAKPVEFDIQDEHLAASMCYTSGTTGNPKGVVYSHRSTFLHTFGAMTVGVPVMPVSPAYSLMSQDHEKLKSVIAHNDPSVIFVENPEPFARAIGALDLSGRTLVVSAGAEGISDAVALSDWMAVSPGEEVEEAASKMDLDTIGKVLLTSGSTGMPKGVLNTHRMMVSNQVSIAQIYPFLQDEPPVFLDWLPWNHTFGGNHNLNMVLHNGGTMYIDEGRPVPGRIEATIANLREISPTLYLNVPRGYDLMLPLLEQDDTARDSLFRNLKKLFFAGAALPPNVWERLDALAIAACGERVP